MSPPIRWDQLPVAATLPAARDWLEAASSGLSAATVGAYSRAVERYLARCHELRLSPHLASTAQLASYFEELQAAGLGGAAIRQRYVAIRLFYAWVVERRERADNPLAGGLPLAREPAPEGSTAPARGPWLPSEGEWSSVVTAAASEPVRTRLMVALAYLGALRREDLCRIEVSKGELRRGRLTLASPGVVRVILIPAGVAARIDDYLGRRRSPTRLFTSESRRNADEPITVWTWAKVTRQLALRSRVPRFSSAALRHLRLTDLARAGRSAREIADFAGYRSPRLAYRYIQLARRRGVTDVERRRDEQVERLLEGRAS